MRQPTKIHLNVICAECGCKGLILVSSSEMRKNGKYKQRWLCRTCNAPRIKNKRGRSYEKVCAIGAKNMPPVKVFTQAEIDEVADTITPAIKKQTKRYLRAGD